MGPTMGDDPLDTQRDVTPTVTTELDAAGFADAQEIGRGGFGVVYRCRQTELDRTVAVKVLTADLDGENRARFFREQRAMGRLTGHPNIVNVLQVGATDRGHPYIVMPYHPLDSLDARIRGSGPLGVDEVLRLGVKLAGALETAHRAGIVHRDVKPANVLVTDYGEPELTDFGIAHIAGGFETGTGTVTGSPAFTAPEVLSGDPPSAASDIYGLGATLFCALTGHAAFERHSGEQVIAQFLRITTQPVPDLREQGIPDDVCAVVERAMATAPGDRPGSAAALGEALQQIQAARGRAVDEMALHGTGRAAAAATAGVAQAGSNVSPQPRHRPRHAAAGNLPLELTSFVGRRRELTEARAALSDARLVTLTGIGGVGKTRLALRVAADARRGFPDGVYWVELGELTDESLLIDVVAATLGLRDHSARPLRELVVEFLADRRLLLVLDNCEQVVDAVAQLSETLLRSCSELRVLATSRESLSIGGEVVLRVPPLTAPEPDREPTLRGLPQFDAVTLFAERAAAAVPGFMLSEQNKDAIARICHRLDGLPLPIELAAARLRAMSVEQILGRLTDRYGLLTLGDRGAPTRQQTLRLSIDWSYDLCTTQEQQLWSRLSVFAGSVELDGIEGVCADNPDTGDALDTVTSLVDKSILIREESSGVVRFRMLETLRDYGREKLEEAGESERMRRRHRDWYLQLALQADTEWISSRQIAWIDRLRRELANLRESLESSLKEPNSLESLRMATALFPFWMGRSMFSEGRYWFDRILDSAPGEPSSLRIRALCDNSELAEAQGDVVAGTALVAEGRALAEHTDDPTIEAYVAYAEGVLALFAGDLPRARARLEAAALNSRSRGHSAQLLKALMLLGTVNDLLGDSARSIDYYQQVLDITGSVGESMYRAYTLWALGVATYRQGDDTSALRYLTDGLTLARRVDAPLTVATCLEAFAWIADRNGGAARAAVLMGAAEATVEMTRHSTVLYPNLNGLHEQCKRRIQRILGERVFEKNRSQGASLDVDKAVAFALGEPEPEAAVTTPSTPTTPTKRERQVADLVAEGLTNKEIAARLQISPRTAQGHVEHLLSKLGFNSRAQIAAWVVEQERR